MQSLLYPALRGRALLDQLGLEQARRTRRNWLRHRCSNITGTWNELAWNNSGDFTAVSNTAAEASLLSGLNDQPVLFASFFHNKVGRLRDIRFVSRGVFSNTSTPTLIFQWRMGTTSGSGFLSGTSIGVSAAITTAAGVTNKFWESVLDVSCITPGIGAGNTTLRCSGYVASYSGFASPFFYPLEPTTPDTATWTASVDNSVTQFINLSVTWSAASASNTITCKHLQMFGLN